MQAAVEKRGDLLDQTDLELERNVGNAKRSAKEAGVAHKKYALSFVGYINCQLAAKPASQALLPGWQVIACSIKLVRSQRPNEH